MAANENIDDLRRQVQELANKVQAFGGQKITDISAYITGFGGGIEGATRALTELRTIMRSLDTDTDYFYSLIKDITATAKPLLDSSKAITRQFSSLGSIVAKLKLDQDSIDVLDKKGLQNLAKKIAGGRLELEQRIKIAKIAREDLLDSIRGEERIEGYRDTQSWKSMNEQLAHITANIKRAETLLGKENDQYNEQFDSIRGIGLEIEHRLEMQRDINKNLGATGVLTTGLIKTLGKLGISSEYFDNITENIRVAASQRAWDDVAKKVVIVKDKTAAMKAAAKGIGEGMMAGLKDPLLAVTFLVKEFQFFYEAALKANRQIVDIGKTLGTDASDYRKELVGIQKTSDNINVTTSNLVEAQSQLTEATGFAAKFTRDQLETQVMLTKQYGLTAEEAGNVTKLSILNNTTAQQTLSALNRALVLNRNQVGVQINMKAALIEATKVAGQLAANLGYSPDRIAAAVIQTKALGLQLEQAKNIGHKMLDFESSISNELEAQLITGENINLDEARILALKGDHVGVAKQITGQGITLVKFSRMNVLQQESIAQSLGMSADEMATMLSRQQMAINSGKSFAAITEEENRKAMERQSIEERFAATMDKIKSIVSDLVAGPFGQLLDSLSIALSKTASLINMLNRSGLLGILTGAATGGAIGSLFGGVGIIPGAILGGIGGGLIEHMSDGVIGPGPKIITTSEGSIALNDKDSLAIAGTDMFNRPQSPSLDISSLSMGIKEVTNAIKNQKFVNEINLSFDMADFIEASNNSLAMSKIS